MIFGGKGILIHLYLIKLFSILPKGFPTLFSVVIHIAKNPENFPC